MGNGIIVKDFTEAIEDKINGENGANNLTIKASNVNSVAELAIVSTSPSQGSPSIAVDFDPVNRRIVVYADTGSGYTHLGQVNLS